MDTVGRFFKDGLAEKDFCLWVASAHPGDQEIETLTGHIPHLQDHIRSGNVEITAWQEWYLKNGEFDRRHAQRLLDDKTFEARTKGYSGLRMFADEAWLTQEQWKAFYEYEEICNETLSTNSVTAVCAYPLGALSAAQLVDLTQTHQFAGVRRNGKWALFETSELRQAKSELGARTSGQAETAGSLSMPAAQNRSKAALLLHYGLSVVLVALAGFLLILMSIWLHGSLPYVPVLLFAVLLSAWFGGIGPGLLSSVLATFVFACIHLLPYSSFESPNLPRLIFISVLAVLVTLLSAAQRRATSDLRVSRDTLQRNNAVLQSEIMERIRAMDSLRETNHRLDMIVNNSPLPITGVDAGGRITDWNKAAEEVFGWTAQETIGRICPTVPPQGMNEFMVLPRDAGRDRPRARVLSPEEKRRPSVMQNLDGRAKKRGWPIHWCHRDH